MSSLRQRRRSRSSSSALCEERFNELVSTTTARRLSQSSGGGVGVLVPSPKLERKQRDERKRYEDAFNALSRKTPTKTRVTTRTRAISPIPDTPPSSQDGWTDDSEEDEEEESSQ